MRPARTVAGAALLGGALVVTTACGSGSTGAGGSADGAYRVTLVAPLSGPYGSVGSAAKQSVEAATATFNKQGGVDGHKISLTVVDDKSDPAQAVAGVESELSSSSPPNAVLTTLTYQASALAPILAKTDSVFAPGIVLPQYSDATKYPRFLFDVPDDAILTEMALKHIAASGAKHIGVVLTTDAYGELVNDELKSAASAAKVSVSVVNVDVDDVDLSSQLDQLKSKGVDALYVNTVAPVAAHALAARHTLDWNVPTLLGATAGTSDVAGLVKGQGSTSGVELQCFRMEVGSTPKSDLSPGFQQFYAAVKKQGKMSYPVEMYAYPWDGLAMIVSAAKAAGSTKSDDIAAKVGELRPGSGQKWVVLKGATGMTSNRHVEVPKDSDVTYVPISPLKDGLLQTSAS